MSAKRESMEISFLEKDTDAWDNYVYGSEAASIYHLSGWREVIKESFGHDAVYLYARDTNGQIAGILPMVQLTSILFGNYMVSVPFFNYGGVLAEDDSIREKLISAAKAIALERGVAHIEFRDTVDIKASGLSLRSDKVSMRLKLPPDEDLLWANLGGKLRAQIKRPLREGAKVKTGGSELLGDFYDVFAENMRDLGTPVYGVKFFESIFRNFGDSCRLVVVNKNDKPVAVGFLIGFNGVMEIPWASSLREFNRIGVNMLMYWEALRYSLANNYTIFDFGRSSVNSGTYRFKKQWGAEPLQLYWHYWLREGDEIPRLNPSNPKYGLGISMWKRLPLPVATWLGPKIVKYLP